MKELFVVDTKDGRPKVPAFTTREQAEGVAELVGGAVLVYVPKPASKPKGK